MKTTVSLKLKPCNKLHGKTLHNNCYEQNWQT